MSGVSQSSLAWGVVFSTVGLAYLLEEAGVWQVRLSVLIPALLIVAGLALAVSALAPEPSEGRP